MPRRAGGRCLGPVGDRREPVIQLTNLSPDELLFAEGVGERRHALARGEDGRGVIIHRP